jgi:hypothetical protein
MYIPAILREGTGVLMLITWGAGSAMFFSRQYQLHHEGLPTIIGGYAVRSADYANNAGTVNNLPWLMSVNHPGSLPYAMQRFFGRRQVGVEGIAVAQFISGLRTAFTISFVFSLLAAAMSYSRGEQVEWEVQQTPGLARR